MSGRRRIVIAGGGTAGWMTAAALARALPRATTEITLVESEEIGRVGVGEATIPPIRTFLSMLGIDENAMIRATQASFKLGIEFVEWTRLGHRYLHPFGEFGVDLGGVKFRQVWKRLDALGLAGGIEDYCLPAVVAKLNRFARPAPDPNSVLSRMAYALHFDAALFAQFLREFSEGLGVNRLEGRIARVRQHGETGHVAGLDLSDGRGVDGDLFIDCTGFRGLLIAETMGKGYHDWSRWLPNDRAVAVPCRAADGTITPYTRSTAREAGWQWRIPLQHRVGNGYVYSSAHISDADAQDRLMASLEGPALADPRLLTFTGGMREAFWAGNVVAIGLSSGFMEPLESTSIHLIQTGITRLLALFPSGPPREAEIRAYNRLMSEQFEGIRDFLILHFNATERRDTPYWRDCAAMSLPDSLMERIELFRWTGRLIKREDELFADDNWAAVMLGQGITPERWDPLADQFDPDATTRQFAGLAQTMRRAAEAMPDHAAYLARHCAAVSQEPSELGLESVP